MSELIPYNGNNKILITPREKEICDVLVSVNQLRSFKLDPIEILEWKDSILRIFPEIEVGVLQFAIDQMMTGELEYVNTRGIQNIFAALKLIGKNEEGYYIKKPIW